MSYMALYRAWRPQSFAEVVGQEKTVQALQNALKQERISHAYLFSGPRGTGKTSIAKIVARAVNCSQPEEGDPCNRCPSCEDILQGNFMDVIEIDAASNRGIDEIRDLREKVRMLPAQGKKKVYIIDEVHMLTTEAFNALLKTLEEPPDSVIFILATTELQKIPATILSRCQRYHFRRLTAAEIIARLRQVADSNHMEVAEEAFELIARRANGGMRDALSALDQIYAYKGAVIDKGDALDVMGLVDDLFLGRLMEAIFARDIGTVITMLGQALQEGKEAQQIAREAVLYLRDLLVYSLLGTEAELAVVTDSAQPYLEKLKNQTEPSRIMQALHTLMAGADRLRFSEGNRFQLEVAFLELMVPQEDLAPAVSQSSPLSARAAVRTETAVPATPAQATAKTRSKASSGRRSDPSKAAPPEWISLLAAVKEKKIPTHALLAQGKMLAYKDNMVTIGFKKAYKFHKEKLEESANKKILDESVREVWGKAASARVVFIEEDAAQDPIVKKALELFGEDKVEVKD
ncbi:MAG: DNA polymerase III subunit gamma/tau [Syntrophomonadaceae bacterium]|jgi:DNA polymerase-3 subunit gamma/tau